MECVLNHSTVTGDGSKTFILLMASLLRIIHTTACKEPHLSHTYNSKAAAEAATARHLADKLLAFALEELDDLIAIAVVPYGCCLSWEDFTAKTQLQAHTNSHCVQNLLASFFYSRLGRTHCELMSNLTCELLTHWKIENDLPSSSLHFVNDNLAALHTPVSGFPISCSRLIMGQVIHRDFAAHCPQTDHQLVKAVVFTGYLQPKLLRAEEVLELGCGEQGQQRKIVHFSAWAERSLECVIAKLRSLGVSVLMSAVKQSAAVLALALQAEMSVVECVSEDELTLFARLSRTTPVTDCWMIEPEHVATLTYCRPILLGAHRYDIMSLFLSQPLCISKVTHVTITFGLHILELGFDLFCFSSTGMSMWLSMTPRKGPRSNPVVWSFVAWGKGKLTSMLLRFEMLSACFFQLGSPCRHQRGPCSPTKARLYIRTIRSPMQLPPSSMCWSQAVLSLPVGHLSSS